MGKEPAGLCFISPKARRTRKGRGRVGAGFGVGGGGRRKEIELNGTEMTLDEGFLKRKERKQELNGNAPDVAMKEVINPNPVWERKEAPGRGELLRMASPQREISAPPCGGESLQNTGL